MIKPNNYEIQMFMKYGDTWKSPLFDRKAAPASQSTPKAVQTLLPVVDDATEAKSEVYEQLSAEAQRQKVYEVIKLLKFATDNQVARRLRIHPSTVAARRNELIERGKVLPVIQDDKKVRIKDDITNTLNTVWRAV